MEERKEKKNINMINNLSKIIIPRDLQNANSLIFSKNTMNKYSWEKDGENIINTNKFCISPDNKRTLKMLLLKKVPDEMRPKVWLLTSGAKREIINNPNYYKSLTESFPKCIPSPYKDQIEVDVRRTFPDEPFFRNENTLQKLKNILLAYSRRNITIGYCQGFNFIVGRLLKIFSDEEEAFWVFVQIIENYLPLNYYSNMCGVMVDSAIINRLLEIYLPELYNFMASLGYEMNLNNIIYKWLVSIYSHNLPEKLTYLIWDVLFLDNSPVLFKAAIGIFKSLKKVIMSQTTTDGIQNVLDEYPMFIDESSIVYFLILRKFEFDIDFIEKNRIIFGKSIIDSYFKSRLEKANLEKKKMLEDFKENKILPKDCKRNSYFNIGAICNNEWPLCIYDTYYKFEITEFFVFKTLESPAIFEDYFFKFIDDNQSDKTLVGSSNDKNSMSKKISDIKMKIQSDNNQRKISSINSLNSENIRESTDSHYFITIKSKENFTETKRHKIKRTKLFQNYYQKEYPDNYKIKENNIYFEENESELEEEEFFASRNDNSNENSIDELIEDKYDECYKPYEEIIIERRPHFCDLLFPKQTPVCEEKRILNFSEKNSIASTELNLRNWKRRTDKIQSLKIRDKKYIKNKLQNKSFTAINPYLLIKFENTDSQQICSNFISTIRKNHEGKDNKFLNISEFNLLENPFSPKENVFNFNDYSKK